MTPSITFTMTDRTIQRARRNDGPIKAGSLICESRQYEFRTTISWLPRARFRLFRYPASGKIQAHYATNFLSAINIVEEFGHGLDWDSALQLIKERIIAQLVCKRLQESTAL